MSLFDAPGARLLVAAYRLSGRSAIWKPVGGGDDLSCTVIHRPTDDVTDWGGGRGLIDANLLLVRRSEVPSPARGDTVELSTGIHLKIIAQPRREPNGAEWLCEAEDIEP